MTDSVAVFPPGYRLTDSATGEPISGATILFYNAGTTTPKTVYADSALLIPLGTSVVTDALGCPTSDGATKTDVFVGTAPYKVIIEDANGVTIETKDNRPGAVVSASSVNVAVTALFPVSIKSLDYTVLQADQNTTFVGNCTAGDVNFTLPSAVPGVGTGFVTAAGWKIKIQHGGSANHVVIKTVSSQSLSGGVAGTATQLVLVRQGEEVELSSDGGNWRVSGHTLAAPHSYTTGIIQIVSRLATAPGSPAAGDKYIVTANGGAWSSFAAGDIATWNGASWTNQTPPSNCGWRAFVQAESRDYQYLSSAWNAQPLSVFATQATMESQNAGTPVTADMQTFHPGHPKAWCYFAGNGTVNASHNVSSVTRTGTGTYGVTLAIAMSSTAYAVVASGSQNATIASAGSQTTTTFAVISKDFSNSPADNNISFAVYGDR